MRSTMSCLFLASMISTAILLAGCHPGARTIQVDGRTRTYELHAPAAQDAAPRPLVIALHQFSDTARGMQRLTGFDAVADEENFLVVYPDGLGRRWRVGERGGRVDDVNFLLALIDAVDAAYPVDRARIYVTGASNGGMMAQYFACETDVPAAIAPVMGSLTRDWCEGCARTGPLPVLLIHGTDDPVVPYEGSGGSGIAGQIKGGFVSAEENAAFWAARNGAAAGPDIEKWPDSDPEDGTRVDVLRHADGAAPALLYRVNGGGHTWPGHKNYYPRFFVSRASMEFDATRVIWDFFKAHARP